jgi:hypothetical protein
VVDAPDVTNAKSLQVATAPDDQGFIVYDNGSGGIMAATLDTIPDPPGGGPGPGPGPGSGSSIPLVAVNHQVASAIVNDVALRFYGPKSCVAQGQKVQLKLTGKQRKHLPKAKRAKLLKVILALDKKKKTDKKTPYKKNFLTSGFAKGSTHKIAVRVYLSRKKPTAKKFTRTLKGKFKMCS